ncbi:2-methylcitrate dehydratase PrpD [Modestobacter sp. DSM 44400]|uniref:MmgE/PrpD family protein n=1 Tax=Modestobacter sp. DSM 44400 TaxID=1550230 RepID=UPI00089987B3|nr:MmgE/PrpD family protein [Modestobacter sp. DSM 44400]SDY72656.1 2-methylcitrate dehydratase PrpD [Modestobacter sp. DSM 44400]
MSAPPDVRAFIHGTDPQGLPVDVVHQARRCLLDLIGVAAAGTATALSQILRDHADRQAGGSSQSSRLLFDGRRVGAAHAALANAGTIDAVDGHDGHRLVKGHAGAAVLPAVLAFMDGVPGRAMGDLLSALVVGYEVSLRAGITLHRTAADYHSSGAWNAIGSAAVGARLLGLDDEATSHALGIAEYSAPRGPMMRAIDHPTMVKDSSAWGAQAGVAAAFLARDGFTGAPAELVERTFEGQDLGVRWWITEQYFKPYPVCRWAHPAVQAGLGLRVADHLSIDQIEDIEVITFDAAARLRTSAPRTTEEAQYSLPFALASALVHGELAPDHIVAPQQEAAALGLAEKIRLTPSRAMTDEFPATRRAQVRITFTDGRSQSSALTPAEGDPESPLSDDVLLEKFRDYTHALGRRRSDSIAEIVMGGQDARVDDLTRLLMAPI